MMMYIKTDLRLEFSSIGTIKKFPAKILLINDRLKNATVTSMKSSYMSLNTATGSTGFSSTVLVEV